MAGAERLLPGAGADPVGAALAATESREPFLGLDGGRAFGSESWGPLASLVARTVRFEESAGRFPDALARRIAKRRAEGGPGGTGIAVVMAYDREALGEGARGDLVLEVDAALRGEGGGATVVARSRPLAETGLRLLERGRASVPSFASAPSPPPHAPRTSLPREPFLNAARTILRHVKDGEIYQANLTQRFEATIREPAESLWERLRGSSPAPRAAFVRGGGAALVSLSPEVFLDVSPEGEARTLPIKGTRARGSDPRTDAAAAAELLGSGKDRAELVMIVDLERNDLGRVSRTGSVRVSDLGSLRSFPAVHHLVATVTSRLRPEAGPSEWVGAIFPGGSVTGAPKERAMRILAEIEPVPRGWYTGGLFWFDDDGWTRSSILIRSLVTRGGIARVGAGGGIVAESDPESEWIESNHKARALTRALGFEPEEAR
jgi:anthranilate/para-aminobenzoate synthase component I